MADILFKDLSYKLNGILFNIHNKLGRFCNHKQYCDAFEAILKKEKIKFKREEEIPIEFEGVKLTGNILDFLIDNVIVVDIKCKKIITGKDCIQMKRYLNASNCELGIIVNFAEKSLKLKRILDKK